MAQWCNWNDTPALEVGRKRESSSLSWAISRLSLESYLIDVAQLVELYVVRQFKSDHQSKDSVQQPRQKIGSPGNARLGVTTGTSRMVSKLLKQKPGT